MTVSISRRRTGGISLRTGTPTPGPAPILTEAGDNLTNDKLVTALDDASASRVYEARRQQVQAIVDRS